MGRVAVEAHWGIRSLVRVRAQIVPYLFSKHRLHRFAADFPFDGTAARLRRRPFL